MDFGGIERIVSGGQTGVDRAALDVALKLGVPCGGWCPRGRMAEDGRIPRKYPLQETDSSRYSVRTRANVADSDGTLVLTNGAPTGGTALTVRWAERLGKPVLVVRLDQRPRITDIRRWLKAERIRVLNVAGPRLSQQPDVYTTAAALLERLLAPRRRSSRAATAAPPSDPAEQNIS